MKITIDIPELDTLNGVQDELNTIDQQLTALVQAIAAGQPSEPGQPFAVQLQQLLNTAMTTFKNAPTDDTRSYVERYAQSIARNAIIRCLRPQQQQLATRLKQLQRQVNQVMPQDDLQEGRWHKELNTRLGNEQTLQLADSVRLQVEQHLNNHLEGIEETV